MVGAGREAAFAEAMEPVAFGPGLRGQMVRFHRRLTFEMMLDKISAHVSEIRRTARISSTFVVCLILRNRYELGNRP